MFVPPVPVADVQVTALCDVAADPARFAGQSVTIRGTLAQPNPESLPSLTDESCGRGMGLGGVSPDDAERLRHASPRPASALVTGTVAFARCAGQIAAGTSCRAYLRVIRVETATFQTAER